MLQYLCFHLVQQVIISTKYYARVCATVFVSKSNMKPVLRGTGHTVFNTFAYIFP